MSESNIENLENQEEKRLDLFSKELPIILNPKEFIIEEYQLEDIEDE